MTYGYFMGEAIIFCSCSEAIRKKAGIDRVVVDDLVFYFCKKCGLELSDSVSTVLESQRDEQKSFPSDDHTFASDPKTPIEEDVLDGLLPVPKPTMYKSILTTGRVLLSLGILGLLIGLLTFTSMYYDRLPGIIIMSISGAFFTAGFSLLFIVQFIAALGEIVGMHIANAANFLSEKPHKTHSNKD